MQIVGDDVKPRRENYKSLRWVAGTEQGVE